MFEELLVVAAHFHALYILQPPRISAEFPFGTYIRTGAQYNHHALFGCYLDVFGEVFVSFEIPNAGLCLVYVPEYICGYGVKTHALHHL